MGGEVGSSEESLTDYSYRCIMLKNNGRFIIWAYFNDPSQEYDGFNIL